MGIWKSRALLGTVFLIAFSSIGMPISHAALTISSSQTNVTSTTGGGSFGAGPCGGTSVLVGIGGQTTNYESTGTYKATLTQVTGTCAPLSADGQTVGALTTGVGGPFGSTAGTALTSPNCSSSGGNQVIVGARVFKTSTSAFAAGVTLLCGTLPLGTNRTYGSSLGDTTPTTHEDIACAAGSVAIGIYVFYGGIEDRFGITCAPILTIPQSISISSLGTNSTTYPYSQTLATTTTGSNGTGSITFSVANGTATSCALSSSASNATLSAGSSGTCLVTATIASDTNYVSTTSSAATFTFNLASQSAITIIPTGGTYGIPLTLSISGGSGTGSVTYSSANGTTSCSVAGAALTAAGAGTCLVTATKAADINYSQIQSSQTTVTFAQGITGVTAALSTGLTSSSYRNGNSISSTFTGAAGKATYYFQPQVGPKKPIPGCKNIATTVVSPFTASCPWKPATLGPITITVVFTPTNSAFLSSTSSFVINVYKRVGTR